MKLPHSRLLWNEVPSRVITTSFRRVSHWLKREQEGNEQRHIKYPWSIQTNTGVSRPSPRWTFSRLLKTPIVLPIPPFPPLLLSSCCVNLIALVVGDRRDKCWSFERGREEMGLSCYWRGSKLLYSSSLTSPWLTNNKEGLWGAGGERTVTDQLCG